MAKIVASAYRYTPLGLFFVEKDVWVSKLTAATELSFPSQMNPKRIMHNSMPSLTVPRKLFRRMPHVRDMLCNRQENALTAMAMAATLPALRWASDASRTATAKATEFVAVLPKRRMKEMPKTHVARNLGRLKK